MSSNTVISSFCSHLRNATMAGRTDCNVPFSKIIPEICTILKEDGFLNDFQVIEIRKGVKTIKIKPRYYNGKSALRQIVLASKPGRRLYTGFKEIRPFKEGLGYWVVSTNAGICKSSEMALKKLGGEVLFGIF